MPPTSAPPRQAPPMRSAAAVRTPLGASLRQGPGKAAGHGNGDEVELDLGGDGGTGGTYGSVGAARLKASDAGVWLRKTAAWLESSEDTDPARCLLFCGDCEEEFRPRRLKAPFVLAWLILQAMGSVFQATMLTEIGRHLADYEGALRENCGPSHLKGDVCLGPSWNLSYAATLDFPPGAGGDLGDFDVVVPADKTFGFETRSAPPTFLVGVEPAPPHERASWVVDLRAGAGCFGKTLKLKGAGSKYFVPKMDRAGTPPACRWTGSLTLQSRQADGAKVHLYIVDSMIEHLEDIHKQPQCSFEDSWKNFNERHNGQHHQVLSRAWSATAFFLAVSLLCIAAMLRRFLYFVEGGRLLGRLIAAKFFLQDLPQQVCIIAYLYGWYAQDGLRCQMCLFHPRHCDEEYPLHWNNLMVCLFTLMSACSNQLLLQMKRARQNDEDQEVVACLVRFTIVAISTLPFSTAGIVLAHTLWHLRSVAVYFLLAIPCVLGWATLFCVPLASSFDEEL